MVVLPWVLGWRLWFLGVEGWEGVSTQITLNLLVNHFIHPIYQANKSASSASSLQGLKGKKPNFLGQQILTVAEEADVLGDFPKIARLVKKIFAG